MFTIAQLLEKFKTIKNPAEDKQIVQQIIKENTGALLQISDINFKDNKIQIKTHPAFRNLIYIKKKTILERIQLELKNRPIVDII